MSKIIHVKTHKTQYLISTYENLNTWLNTRCCAGFSEAESVHHLPLLTAILAPRKSVRLSFCQRLLEHPQEV